MPRQDAPANLSRLTQLRIIFFANAGWWIAALPVVLLLSLDVEASALADAVALTATTVAGWLTTGEVAAYLVGVPFTLLAAARAAPTRQRIAIDQQEVDGQGSTLSLRDLLDRSTRPAS